jgi:hypothetical protein
MTNAETVLVLTDLVFRNRAIGSSTSEYQQHSDTER